jgi:hypothetical protein
MTTTERNRNLKATGISNTINQGRSLIESSFKASKEDFVIQNERFTRIEEKEDSISSSIQQGFKDMSSQHNKSSIKTLEIIDKSKIQL